MTTQTPNLPALPIGMQNFARLRSGGNLYVDKTERLVQLATQGGGRYFLSRPRRFGKSLTVSTLDAMFSGKTELFQGLSAENWVREQAKAPAPVLHLSMARGLPTDTVKRFDLSLYNDLMVLGHQRKLPMLRGDSEGALGAFKDVLEGLYDQGGPVVALIDEYDKPILDNIDKPGLAEEFRCYLRDLYLNLKDYDGILRFVFLTGISKFSKVGVFSAMNNLRDISMQEQFGDMVGYTQEELERDFSGWLAVTSEKLQMPCETLLKKIKSYYDGFSFDGTHRLYNPFSVLNFLAAGKFSNYWYTSGSPSFIVSYMKKHAIQHPDEYRQIEVGEGFVDNQEIEQAKAESFLYQAGYLTIANRREQSLTLDYPNREVLDSISRMYLEQVYQMRGYTPLGNELWQSLKNGDIQGGVTLYNTALAAIPYQDFGGPVHESFFRALFLMLLRGAGVTAGGEIPSNLGRSDVVALFADRAVVLEFKLAQNEGEIERLKAEGLAQISEKNYAEPWAGTGRVITTAVLVVNTETREAFCATT